MMGVLKFRLIEAVIQCFEFANSGSRRAVAVCRRRCVGSTPCGVIRFTARSWVRNVGCESERVRLVRQARIDPKVFVFRPVEAWVWWSRGATTCGK